ncbi:MAG TPA: PBP1A family penicillin-binding protein [Devosiaceae bacterium]|jgi:penicillin-binding protein 1A
MQDPFYHKEKRRKKSRMLAADAWLDSTLYESWRSLGRSYTRYQDFMAFFHVSGFRRLFVEIFSDLLTFGTIGAILMTALALPAFNATASGQYNGFEDISVVFLDRYGNEVGRRGIRSDDSVALDKLPDYLIKATLATEDRRFYDHFGIDVWGTVRALASNAQGDGSLQGGSSLTQQLAKNLFLSNERTIERKIKEAFLALWLESHYTKDQILKLYFDRAYMGGGNFGVAAAAEFYFGKKVTDINLAEAAMLAGMFKAPTKYAPHVDLAAARGRANQVLTNMVDAGFLTEGQVTAARRHPATPVDRTAEVNSPDYFLDYAFDQVKTLVANKTNSNNFVVRTTIDPVLQSYAEESLNSVIRDSGAAAHITQGALVATEPNGAIRAMVGGVDYAKSQFNRATDAGRQPGSSFKIFVYSTAFEQLGLKPTSVVSDVPLCIGNWCPQNFERSFSGRVSLASAFAESLNTVAVNLSVKTGRQPIADMAHRMGITNDFPVTRSLALGVASVSVIDMTSAYSVVASGGYKTPAYGITRIDTLSGQTVYQADVDAPRERVLSEQTVAYMDELMRGVVTHGTGTRANIPGVPVLGKTGTTSSFRDAWFCGFTGNYVAAVWLGNDDYKPTANITGGTLPATVWHKFMAYAHTNVEIKPVPLFDFTPVQVVTASAEPQAPATPAIERPPGLKPEAAQKLLDVAGLFDSALQSIRSPAAPEEATLVVSQAAPGL